MGGLMGGILGGMLFRSLGFEVILGQREGVASGCLSCC
jgi:hypothetical protein